MCLIKRYALWKSPDSELRHIASSSALHNCKLDEFIASNKDISKAKRALKDEHTESALQHVLGLETQGLPLKEVTKVINAADISLWSNTVESLPASKLIFARKAISQVLPTASNLVRWGRSDDARCHLCTSGAIQTNKHVLSNCSSEIALKRYTSRHNEILSILASWIKTQITSPTRLYVDLSGTDYLPLVDLFKHLRPDIAIRSKHAIAILELTVCHETNLTKSRDYKCSKYSNISQLLTEQASGLNVKLFTCEVSTLGFIADISAFTKACKLPKLPKSTKEAIIKSALSNSFNIYCNRNNACDAVL